VVVEVARNVLEAPPLAENGAAPSVWIRRQVPVLVLEAVQEWRKIKAEAPVEANRLEVRRDAVVNFMLFHDMWAQMKNDMMPAHVGAE